MVVWERDGVSIVSDSRQEVSGRVLRIPFASEDYSGAYTVKGMDVEPIEVEIDPNPFADIMNASVRGYVQEGRPSLIVGFCISRDQPREVLVRAVGPTLTEFGVDNVLQAPAFKVFDSQGEVVFESVDNRSGKYPPETVFRIAGAFPLKSNSEDRFAVLRLKPGNYTVQVSSRNPSLSGEVLAEVYLFPYNTYLLP